MKGQMDSEGRRIHGLKVEGYVAEREAWSWNYGGDAIIIGHDNI